MIRLFTTLLFGSVALSVFSQTGSSLFLPRNLQRAYDKGTRSADGSPGPNYWQNRASYTMTARIDPSKRRLKGTATVVYTNNSPDALKIIRFKLAHDRYRKGGQRGEDVNPNDVDEGVAIHKLVLNGQPVPLKQQHRHATFLDIQLGSTPVTAGATATFTVEWAYTLPADPHAERECVCDASTFFVPYWYPQIAVYDDYHGWADAPYTGQQEFYNDFADYDVTITMPRGYMVWATGEWQNAPGLLQSPFLERFDRAHTTGDVVSVFTEAELKAGGVFKPGKANVFHYKAENVPDFVFAASDHYNWDATSVVVDDQTGRRTFVSAAYNTLSPDFYRVARIAADGIRLMSTWLPGYPFPYPCETIFNGNDGMEYPMMVNDASASSDFVTTLTVHEASHTYFPFMMGINEQDYAWMDEGWASFFDLQLVDSLSGIKGNLRGYAFMAGTESDIPPMVRARFLSGNAYNNASYARPQSAYLTLLDLLGYDTFHHCMVAYMDRWKGKHPMPHDFFNTWNTVSGQNLDWFWKPWFFDWGYPDLGIRSVEQDQISGADVILVEKNGAMPIPVHLDIRYSDGSRETVHLNAGVWRNGETTTRISCPAGKTAAEVTLGDRLIPDTVRKNNTWKKG